MTAQVTGTDILDVAREQVLERGVPLTHPQIVEVMRTGDDRLQDLLALAHEVRMKYQGPSVEVEGIVSLKTGGCPEDCHFCSQSGQFTSPVRSVWLNVPELVRAAKQTAATGASEFCIVAAVRGPDDRLMEQMREGVAAIRAAVDINVAASLGMLSQRAGRTTCVDMGVHRYNHNLEAGRSLLPERRHHALLRRALGHLPDGQGVGHGAVLRRPGRHGRDASSSAPSSPPSSVSSSRTRCR